MEVGYKILRKSRCSIIQSQLKGGIYYPVMQKVKPEPGNGPLCVFGTYKAAMDFKHQTFIRDIFESKIVKCEYEKSQKKSIWSTKSYYARLRPLRFKYLPKMLL